VICKAVDARKIIARPTIPLLFSFITGIILSDQTSWFFNFDYIAVLFVIIFICFILILRKFFTGKSAFYMPILLFLILGYLSFLFYSGYNFPQNHISHYTGLQKYGITGVIETEPFSNGRWLKFNLSVKSLTTKDKTKKTVFGKIKVSVRGKNTELVQGDRITFYGKIKPFRNFANPGGFDYKRYMRFKGIYGSTYVDIKKIKLHKTAYKNQSSFALKLSDLREEFASLVKRNCRNKDAADVLNALIVGKKHQMSTKCKEGFRRAGVSHLLAISGLHTGIIATVSFFFFYQLLLYVKPLLWKALAGKIAAILTIFPVLVYGAIAGFSPSVQRACIMVTVFLLAGCLERESDSLNALSLAAMLILIFSPPSLFSISFQLSFLAVFAILIGIGISFKKVKQANTFSNKIILYIKGSLLVSIFATAGTTPIAMYYFNQVSLVGILSNFLLVPVVCLIVVPVGLFAMLIMNIIPVVSVLCIKLCTFLLVKVINTIYFLSDLPFAAVKTITPTIFEICCYYIFFCAVVLLIKSKSDLTGSFINKKRKYLTLLIVVLIAIFIDVCWWLDYRFWHKELRITAIDVGQGGSTLIELPGGYRVLVDGGGFSDNNIFDVGEKIVAPFLWGQKIKTINLVILTHPEADHYNGLTYIINNFNVQKFWSNNQKVKTKSYKKLIKAVEKQGVINSKFSLNAYNLSIDKVKIKTIYPPDNYLERRKYEKWRNLNNNSLVIKVQIGVISFLLPGDIMKKSEGALLGMGNKDISSTILFAPHHGSKTSSTEEFIDAVKPRVAVISVGWENRFKMPHKSVLERYKRHVDKIFRTDLHGAVTISTDGKTFNVFQTRVFDSKIH